MAEGHELATGYVNLVVTSKGLGSDIVRQFGEVEKVAKTSGEKSGKHLVGSFGGAAKSIGSALKGALAGGIALAGIAGAGQIFGDMIAEARESEKVGKTTAQVIKATGGAAKVSAEQVGDLAQAIGEKAGMDDEAVQSGANLLLTFKNVRNEAGQGADIFNRATAAAVDLSAAGFGSVDSSAKMLGKALNDPVKGISALSRAGVTFTASQKETIKKMAETGDILGAQKLIMKEVESQVGGVASANATMSDKMKAAWGNFLEDMGTRLLPALDAVQGAIIQYVLPSITKMVDAVGGFIKLLATGDVAQEFLDAFGIEADNPVVLFMLDAREAVAEFFGTLTAQVSGPGASGFREFFTGFVSGVQDAVRGAIPGLVSGFQGLVSGAQSFVAAATPIVTQILVWMRDRWVELQPVLGEVGRIFADVLVNAITAVGAALRLVGGIITTVWGVIGPTVLGIATGLFNGLVSIFSGIMNVVGGIWKTLAGILTGDWRKAGEGISQISRGLGDILRGIFTAIGSALVGIVRLLWAGITAVFQAGWNWVSGVFRGMWNGLITILRWPLDMGRAAIASAITQIRNVIMSAWSWASSVFRGAWNGMRSLLTDPISTAKRVLDGLIGGIKSGFSGMVNAIRDTMNRIRAWTAQPINFVINTVYNNGIRNFLNEILKMGGMTQLGPLKSISGYQSGGYVDLPWSASNRDPYLGVTPGGGAFRFEGEEYIVNRDATSRSMRILDAVNSGMLDDSSMPAFAGGGRVVANARQGWRNMNVKFMQALQAWAAAAGQNFYMTENGGARSRADQVRAWNLYQAGKGPLAARPGHSRHESGFAIDVRPHPKGRAKALLSQFGLGLTVPGEAWHIGWLGAKGGPTVPGGGGGIQQVVDVFSGFASKLKDAVGGWWGKLSGMKGFGDTTVEPMARRSVKIAEEYAKKKAAEVNASLMSSGSQGFAYDAGLMARAALAGPIRAQVREVAKSYGWGDGAEWDAIQKIISKESGWQPFIKNPTSSARGLFQKMTSIHGPLEPTVPGQAQWGLNYIRKTYRTPTNAWRFHQAHNYYRDGGQIPGFATGVKSAPAGLAWVGERGPELVNFRGGERVHTASESRRMAGASPEAIREALDGLRVDIDNGAIFFDRHAKRHSDRLALSAALA